MVTRYDMAECEDTYYTATMITSQFGDYVEYCDYKDLEAKYDKLASMIGDLYQEV